MKKRLAILLLVGLVGCSEPKKKPEPVIDGWHVSKAVSAVVGDVELEKPEKPERDR